MVTVFISFNNSYIVLSIYILVVEFLLYRYQSAWSSDYNTFESQLDRVIRILVEKN